MQRGFCTALNTTLENDAIMPENEATKVYREISYYRKRVVIPQKKNHISETIFLKESRGML